MIHVTVLLLDGGFASTAIAPIEILSNAGVLAPMLVGARPQPAFVVRTASLDGEPVRPRGAVTLVPDMALHEVGRSDLVIVPGISADLDELSRYAPIVRWLRRRHRRGREVAGICAGVALLAEAGALDGRRATTHWALADALRARHPEVEWQPDQMITDDRGVYCSGGVYAAMDLSLYLVEKYMGREHAVDVAKTLVLHSPRSHQLGFSRIFTQTPHSDEKIEAAQAWLHDNLAEPVRVEDIARHVGMSARNLARRFKQATGDSPLVYLQKLRVAEAKHMLEQDYASVQEVGAAVGYEELAFFRALFRRHTGMSPSDYRQRFGSTSRGCLLTASEG